MDLKRVELLFPSDILVKIDAQAAQLGMSRAAYLLKSLKTARGSPLPVPESDRLSAIESKLDALIEALQPTQEHQPGKPRGGRNGKR